MNSSEKYFKQKLLERDLAAVVILGFLGFFIGAAYFGMSGVILDAIFVMIAIAVTIQRNK